MQRLVACSAVVVALAAATTLASEQLPDRSFRPMIEDRAYATGTGPVVCFDEGHNNARTLNEGFWPFADLIRRDGYVLRPVTVNRESLAACGIVVIASPRSPVADAEETRTWVAAGGSLLVIVDRESMPAASELASAFGVTPRDSPAKPGRFRSADHTLRPHALVRGRHAKESAASVMTFEAQPMRVPANADPVLVAQDGAIYGAVIRVDSGRAAFFGDAALFTAQIVGPERRVVGMSARGAEQNFQFVLNVMHWLSGVIS